MTVNSRISGFYKLSVDERRSEIKKQAKLNDEEESAIKEGGINLEQANRMIENVIGKFSLPMGIATNFQINGRDYLIPMVTEEPSVVAAASNAAKMARSAGGFSAEADEPVMIGQVQLVGVKDFEAASKAISKSKKKLIEKANARDPTLVKFGGGAIDLKTSIIQTPLGKMLIAGLHVDVRDAMGANAVNTMCETIAGDLEELSGGKARLRIISNLAVKRKARAKAVWLKEEMGEETVDGVIEAWAFAEGCQFRCTTHNKGIMNGVDAVLIATGNDFRAVEAGAHSYASTRGRYLPLTRYSKDKKGNLVGEIEMPLAVGLVGGATKTHPTAQAALKILGVKSAKELSYVIAAVGLAQNFAALKALATEGIQRGHMGLHARNIAIMAGAKDAEIDSVAERMIRESKINVQFAKEILTGLKS